MTKKKWFIMQCLVQNELPKMGHKCGNGKNIKKMLVVSAGCSMGISGIVIAIEYC